MTDTEDRDRIAQALRAVMAALGCEKEWDEDTRYCTTHDVGWLNDVNACVRAETITTAILPLLAEARQQALAGAEVALYAAWDDGNAMGLDGWVGPERDDEPDREAIARRAQNVEQAIGRLR